MNSNDLRRKFLEFFEEKGHKIVASSSLIPTDPSVLFTTAGMQQFKPYYLGQVFPYGPNVVSCQKCFRTSDIEEVGNESHLTFLEMLGNFSFGGYFKTEAIKFAYEFLFEELKLPKEDAIFTVFGGDRNVPEDKESVQIWKKLGIAENKIKKCGRADNFWGPTGEEGPCGPTTEIHINGIEIWNLVFNEYYQNKNKKLTPLAQKGVDTGMGLERLAMIVQDKPSVFETDLFQSLIEGIEKYQTKPYSLSPRPYRIIADHAKGAVFLISEGVLPSNVERGYVLRRILRRAIRYGKLLSLAKQFLIPLTQKVIEIYRDVYPEVKSKEEEILTVIQNEEEKFEKTLEEGLKELKKLKRIGKIEEVEGGKIKIFNRVSARDAFYIYQTFGFPLEMIQEELAKNALLVDEEEFQEEFKKHQEISRAGVENKFGGVGKEAGETSAKLHTATHLLHAVLRQIFGGNVKQMGSDITAQRLRFDFSYPRKMTTEEIKKVQDLVNQKIREDLKVEKEEMSYEEAIKGGALAFFKEKYPSVVTVYSIGDISKEICAGPHAKRTSELGLFRIIKEESSGAGVRRIRAILE
ncbi:MAG: alanine--tRNA ligase [Candidatus Nealsonbacteria bacterium CG02_land_8_20_14_3_00_37_10]|uniref:Alanine--tRNA ligase n=2 Tax=Candidatus Nealsoniibacteriota TaxID=1817911 RepID=A0A2G9YYY2_9BACT|nr:MAG: alanine--tRNA ligase [Candidatus Nealsonbacteria bacterium CG23_combo_of_CG06-09_8_20_14_all_37_18]PIV45208.1 MAG: alanine--tRNA ligase [Candidatus Nealsonbacteria bacterium CG02_land_8_20_14_3_00_37_10]